MQIHNISLLNFKQYNSTQIDFPDGLIGFIGKNGSGKSTIFEAITNAFYGKFENNKDKIRNDKAAEKEPVIISMTFEDKGAFYKINREYKGKNLVPKAELYKDDNLIAVGTHDVNKQIAKIIKIDYTNFKNSFFAHQKDMTSLLNQGVKDRQVALRKMLGLEKMDKLEKRICDEIKEQNSEIRGKRSELLTEAKEKELQDLISTKSEEIGKLESDFKKEKKKVDTAEKLYNELKDKLTLIEKKKDKYDKLNSNIEVQKTNIENNKKNIADSVKELEKLNTAKKEHEALLPQKEKYEELNKRINLLQDDKVKFQKKQSLEETIKSNDVKLEKENKKLTDKTNDLGSYDDIEEKFESLTKLVSSNKETLTSLTDNKDGQNKIIGSLKDKLKDKKVRIAKIESIGKDSDCPECERPLGTHYDKLLTKYKNELSELVSSLEIEEKALLELKDKITSKEKDIAALNTELSELGKRSERKKSLKESIDELTESIKSIEKETKSFRAELKKLGVVEFNEKELTEAQVASKDIKKDYERCLSLGTKKDEIPVKEQEIEKLKESEKALKEKLTQLNKALTELEFNSKDYEEIKLERENKEEELNEIKRILHQKQLVLSQLNNDIKLMVGQIKDNDERKSRIDKLQSEIDLFERLKLVIIVFKEKITSRELPEISKTASAQFASITKGRYDVLKIDNNFNFLVNRDGIEVDLNTLSGGEKDLASLCLRIAISKRISKLAGRSNMGFLALDEVFGSQDEERREELLNALHIISKEFRQIFVVSHNQDIQEQFPTCLIVSKKSGYSTAEMMN